MPRISSFYGIVVEMYFGDHPPPHIHARYSGETANIKIEDGIVIAGGVPPRALRLVREWIRIHREALEENWRLVTAHEPPRSIEPLK